MPNTCKKLELALIGSLLAVPEKIVSVSDIIKPTDFTDSRAMMSYVAILDQYRQKKSVDITSITTANPGMLPYLVESMSESYPPGVKTYAGDISSRAKVRRLKSGVEALSRSTSSDEILSGMIALYNQEIIKGKKNPDIKSIIDKFSKTIKENRTAGRVGFSTGLRLHESIYYRYLPGHIWTMGGFTSVGKTAVMIQKICNLLSNGEGASVVIISTEMTKDQIVARVVSNFTGVNSMRILSGRFHDADEEEKINQAINALSESRLQIYDDIYLLDDIEMAFRRAKLQDSINIGFVDYVQNCKVKGVNDQYQSQATIAKGLQSLAKEIESTIVCLSQVSNSVGRGDTDQLELKGAGEWSAVSDLGVMLYRSKSEKHKLVYEIKKNRHGALGECLLEFAEVYTRLVERDKEL